MARLLICRGLPGSGKTFWARKFVSEKGFSACRINRDDLRNMFHGGVYSVEREYLITQARNAVVVQALEMGLTVVVDDTNLRNHTISTLLTIAKVLSAPVGFILFNTPVDLCIKRDANRLSPVSEAVIRDMLTSMEPMDPDMFQYPCTVVGDSSNGP